MKKILIPIFILISFNANAIGRYTVADVVDKIAPAVVTIKAVEDAAEKTANSNPFSKQSKQKALENIYKSNQKTFQIGSGVIVDASGLIITNHHVIEGADKVSVTTVDNKFYDAKVMGFDEKSDLALLKLNSDKKDFKSVKLADSNKVRIGEFVIAIGNPYGLDGSVSTGIISARNRNIGTNIYDDFLQTDASINPGNSGGPLFNLDGEVIGINTAIFSKTGGSNGIGFAIPANTVELIIKQLAETGKVVRGWLGIQGQVIDQSVAKALKLETTNGVLVADVTANSPAELAKIKDGDVILKYDGKDIKSLFDLPKMVAETPIDTVVDIVVLRTGKQLTLKAKIVSTDAAIELEEEGITVSHAQLPGLGIYVANITDEIKAEFKLNAQNGVVITKVEPAFKKFNIKKGDIILQVDQKNVKTVEELYAHIKSSNKKSLLLFINRKGNNIFSVVER